MSDLKERLESLLSYLSNPDSEVGQTLREVIDILDTRKSDDGWIKVDDYRGDWESLKSEGWWVGGYNNGEWEAAHTTINQAVQNVTYVWKPPEEKDLLPEPPKEDK